MKNSTLLRLFFISIGLPLTCASSLTPKPETDTLTLRDTSNSAPTVQLEGAGTVVPNVPGEISVSGIEDAVPKELEALIGSGDYEQVIKLADGMGKDKFLKHLCQVVTNLDQFKGLFGYLEQRNMVPAFLAHGQMVLVRGVIWETGLLKTGRNGDCDSIYEAIALSLNGDRHGRAADLFEAAHKRPKWRYMDMFDAFVEGFFAKYPPEKNSMPLKRLLTLHGKEFSKKHPDTFEIICQELVRKLRCQLGNLASQKWLIGLVGQPSLLTLVAYVKGFLEHHTTDTNRANFIEYGYKEAIEEGLNGDYGSGGRYLWEVMVDEYPTQFSGEYPSTDEERTAALKSFKPTKQDLEEAWIVNNSKNPQTKLRAKQLAEYLYKLGINFPKVLWVIIAEYTVVPTLLDVE